MYLLTLMQFKICIIKCKSVSKCKCAQWIACKHTLMQTYYTKPKYIVRQSLGQMGSQQKLFQMLQNKKQSVKSEPRSRQCFVECTLRNIGDSENNNSLYILFFVTDKSKLVSSKSYEFSVNKTQSTNLLRALSSSLRYRQRSRVLYCCVELSYHTTNSTSSIIQLLFCDVDILQRLQLFCFIFIYWRCTSPLNIYRCTI